MSLLFYGTKYNLLGRLLAKRRPDVARQLLEEFHRETTQPLETDLTRMEQYLSQFCGYRGISLANVTYNLFKSRHIEYRREFIAAMIHVYSPQVYHQPPADRIFTYRFKTRLCQVLKIGINNIGKMLHEIILHESLYDDFRQRVECSVSYLTKQEVRDGATEG